MENVIIKKRIWEIDLARTICFFLMFLDHLVFDLYYVFDFGSSKFGFFRGINDIASTLYRNDFFKYFILICCSCSFIFLSGISSNLSRSNLKRGIRLSVIALSLTFTTYALSNWIFPSFGFSIDLTIYFGILHCLACLMLLSPLLKKLNNWILLIIAIIMFGLGLWFEKIPVNFDFLAMFNLYSYKFGSADYFPIFPFGAFYLLGIIFGRLVYKNKKSIFKKTINNKFITWISKNCIWLYFAHQIFLFVFLFIIELLVI